MGKNILFYPDEAELLNKDVQDNIASHLTMFCNYDPTLPAVFSIDAQFLKAVMNLYKLLVDSEVVRLTGNIDKKVKISFKKRDLDDYKKYSGTLRTVIAHNPTDMSGNSEDVVWYKNWLKKLINKEQIENDEDYSKPLKELERMAMDAVEILHKFVDKVSQLPDKKVIISEWENSIIEFYCKDSHQNIFKEQLVNIYKATHKQSGWVTMKKRIIAEWIRDEYFLEKEPDKIKKLEKLLELDVLSDSVKENIENTLTIKKENIQKKKEQIAKEANRSLSEMQKNPYLYENLYLSKLKGKLRKALIVIKQSDNGTMMPDDIMQLIIKEDFSLQKNKGK